MDGFVVIGLMGNGQLSDVSMALKMDGNPLIFTVHVTEK